MIGQPQGTESGWRRTKSAAGAVTLHSSRLRVGGTQEANVSQARLTFGLFIATSRDYCAVTIVRADANGSAAKTPIPQDSSTD